MVDTVTMTETPVTGALAPGQTMPENAPTDRDLDPTLPAVEVTKAPEGTPEKFVNADGSLNSAAIVASYTEAEKKLSTSAPAADGETPPAATDDAETAPADLKMAEATYGKLVDDAIVSAGMTPTSVAQEWHETGKLSEATLTNLERAGFSREVVNQYVAGFEAQATAASQGQQLADTAVGQIMDSVGGREAYGRMSTWAETNLSPAEGKAFNDAMDTGDRAVIDLAVRGLHGKFVQAEGQDPSLSFGGTRPMGDVFESAQEASDALHAAQRSGDPAKIKRAQDKALRSNVFN